MGPPLAAPGAKGLARQRRAGLEASEGRLTGPAGPEGYGLLAQAGCVEGLCTLCPSGAKGS